MDGWVDGWMEGWMGGWMGGLVDGWMDEVLWSSHSHNNHLDVSFSLSA